MNSGHMMEPGGMLYLSMGSNLGNREENLRQARELILQSVGSIAAVSGIYESVAWGFTSSHSFLNCCMVVRVNPAMDPPVLMDELLEIERKMGRERHARGYGDRLIDIDILLFGKRVLDLPGLKVPHPSMGERRFVLVPLAEIAGDMVHPVAGLTIGELLEACRDPSEVRLVRPVPW